MIHLGKPVTISLPPNSITNQSFGWLVSWPTVIVVEFPNGGYAPYITVSWDVVSCCCWCCCNKERGNRHTVKTKAKKDQMVTNQFLSTPFQNATLPPTIIRYGNQRQLFVVIVVVVVFVVFLLHWSCLTDVMPAAELNNSQSALHDPVSERVRQPSVAGTGTGTLQERKGRSVDQCKGTGTGVH